MQFSIKTKRRKDGVMHKDPNMTTPTMTLEDVFISRRGNRFLFITPGGNWGDHLIYWGAECLASRAGLEWSTVRVEDFDPAKVAKGTCIYVHGGGGLNPWCSGRAGLALKKAIGSNASLVIQGPTTYDNVQNYTETYFKDFHGEQIQKEVIVFAREFQTLRLLEEFSPNGFSIGLDDDTAFHVRRSDFIQRAGIDDGRYPLCVVRKDNESPRAGQAPRRGVQLDPAIFAKSFEHWLRIHAAATSIATDRTHSSIAGAILGVPTTIYGGSYHKNRSIWEKSLQSRGVVWGEPNAKVPSLLDRYLDQARNKFSNSWKVNQLRLWYYGVPRA